MQKIIRMNGYVYLVEGWDRKGFEIYHNLGKDPDSYMWKEDKPKNRTKKDKKQKEQV